MKQQLLFLAGCLAMLCACTSEQDYIDHPQAGDIYLFEASETYFPVRVDYLEEEYVYCNNSLYVFENDMPEPEDMPKTDFNFKFHYIYQKAELKKLYAEKKIVKVYRN